MSRIMKVTLLSAGLLLLTVIAVVAYSYRHAAVPSAQAQEDRPEHDEIVTPPNPPDLQQTLAKLPSFKGAVITEVKPFVSADTQLRFPIYVDISLSNDGKRLVMIVSHRFNVKFLVVGEFATGTLNVIEPFGDNEPFIYGPQWDPQDPNYLFVEWHADIDPVYKGTRGIWRMRYDGTQKTMLSPKDEDISGYILPPDGNRFLINAVVSTKNENDEPVAISKYYLVPRDNFRKRQPIENPDHYRYLSPDGFIAYFISTIDPDYPHLAYCFYDHRSDDEVPIFYARQVALGYPKSYRSIESVRIPFWLPDSSGVLYPLIAENRADERHQSRLLSLWAIYTDGQVHHVADETEVIANSLNGRHWLFRVKENYYHVAVPEKEQG